MRKSLVSLCVAAMAVCSGGQALAASGCKEFAEQLKNQGALGVYEKDANAAKVVTACKGQVAMWIRQCQDVCTKTYPQPIQSQCQEHCQVGFQNLLF